MWLVISLKFHFSWKLIHDSFVIKYSAKREREKNWKIWKLIRKIFFQRDKGIIGGARGRGNKRVDTKMERHEFPSLLWSVKRESLFWRRVGTSGSRPRVSTTENSTSFSNPGFLSRFEQKTVIIREWMSAQLSRNKRHESVAICKFPSPFVYREWGMKQR